jgi:hypothetical protein
MTTACEHYYEDGTNTPGVTETQMEEGCENYCDAVATTPKWCPGLPPWAIALIVIGSVVFVGGVTVTAGLVYFLLIRKKAAVGPAP